MRIWRGTHLRYDKGRRLATANLPSQPAALPLYSRVQRTTILGLDFDAGTVGERQVRDDVADAVALISRAGGRVIVDRSPSGGMHVWVPLWAQADLRAEMLRPILDAMRRRWRTLDITPMTNPRTGCLTGPGSPCIGGGHRTLLIPLHEAVAAATERSPAGTVARIATALRAPHAPALAAPMPESGAGQQRQPPSTQSSIASFDERPRQHGTELTSPHAREFVLSGRIPAHRPEWTRSEARMSALSCAARTGWSLDEVRQRMRSGLWHGMVDAYAKYGTGADRHLCREWQRALAWTTALPRKVQIPPHQQQHTGGGVARWLAQAHSWVAHTPLLHGQIRTTALAVVDALASAARRTRSLTVAVGGRWLSIGAGLLDEQTVWAALRHLRESEGSPIRWVTAHVGHHADVYELVPPQLDGHPIPVTDHEVAAASTTGVSPVWKVIGHRARSTFELIDHLSQARTDGRVQVRELLQQAPTSRTAVYAAIALLQRWQLVTRGRGWVARTEVTLAEIADAHDVPAMVAERVQRHRAERRAWRALLALWDADTASVCPPSEQPPPPDPMPAHECEQWLAIVMATGPPDDSDRSSPADTARHNVMDLLVDVLGATRLPVPAAW